MRVGRKLSYRPRFANKKVINPHRVRRVIAVQKVGATISKWQPLECVPSWGRGSNGRENNAAMSVRFLRAGYGGFRRVRSLGIRDHPTSARSPWQNGHAERLIGSIRWECLDHIVVIGEPYLRHVLKCYTEYYNEVRTHLSVGKDAPIWRDIQCAGRIEVRPVGCMYSLHNAVFE
jgi:Integrase core domain